jgi:invasion protein IalB
LSRLARTLLAVAALLLPPAAGAQTAGETVRETHGDWDVVCAEGRDVCAMRQVGRNSEGNDVLLVAVRALPEGTTTEDGRTVPALIEIRTPLGVGLRAGVRVQVDGGQERAAPYEVCVQQGCIVRQPMGEDFLAAMKAGRTATMTVVALQQGEVSVDISLLGFTAAFNSLL